MTRSRNTILLVSCDSTSIFSPTSSSKNECCSRSFTWGLSSLRGLMQLSITSFTSGFCTLSKLAGLTPETTFL